MPPFTRETPIRNLVPALLGAATLVVGLVLLSRAQPEDAPAGETVPGPISLERLRSVGY